MTELIVLSKAWRLQPPGQAGESVATAKQLVALFETDIALSSEEVEELSLLADHVISTIFEEKVLHDVYQNLFSWTTSEVSKHLISGSSSLYSSLVHKINEHINSVELSSPLDFRRIEMLLHASVTSLKAIPSTETYVCDLISMIVVTLIKLQEEILSIGRTASTVGVGDGNDSETCKEITASCASLRKKSINSLKIIFITHPQWITVNTETYWNVCISKFKTPLLFIGGYMTNNDAIVHSIINYIKTGLGNVLQYSISTAKEIIKSIQELADYNCAELVNEELLGLLLQNCYFNYSEALIAKQKASNIISWKVSIITVFTTLFTTCSTTDGQPKIMLSNNELVASFTTMLVQDLLFLYCFLGYATDETITPLTSNKKQLSRMSKLRFGTADEDNLMNLAHAVANLLVIYCENCLLDATYVLVDAQGLLHSLVTVLLTNIQREVVFEDDEAHLCCEIDLFARLTQLLARSAHGDDVKHIFRNVKSLLALHTTLSTSNDSIKDIYGDNAVLLLNKIVSLLQEQQECGDSGLYEKDTFIRCTSDEVKALIGNFESKIVSDA